MKKFKSTIGNQVRLSLLSGHTALVGPEWRELPELFHQEAYANGCVSDDMFKAQAMASIPVAKAEAIASNGSREAKILKEIAAMVEGNDLKDFTQSGAPDATILSTRVGERITSQKRNEMWFKFQEELKAE